MSNPRQPQHARRGSDPHPPSSPEGPSRRAVIAGGAAGLTLAASGGLLATGVQAAAASSAAADSRLSDDTVVAHVRNARTGEIDVFVGERQIRIKDRAVAARLASASD